MKQENDHEKNRSASVLFLANCLCPESRLSHGKGHDPLVRDGIVPEAGFIGVLSTKTGT